MKRPRYRCPQCGRKITFGEHYCKENDSEDRSESEPDRVSPPLRTGKNLFKKTGTVLIVAFLAGALLWNFLGWIATFIVGFIIIGGTGLALFFSFRRRDSGSHYRNLLKMAGGDQEKVERLVSTEMGRYPDFSRSQCVRRVHDRWEYEHRR